MLRVRTGSISTAPCPALGCARRGCYGDRSAHSPSATALSPPAAPKQLCTAVRAFPEVPLRWLGWRIPVLWLGTAALPFPFRTAPQPAAQQGLAPGGAFMPIAHFALFQRCFQEGNIRQPRSSCPIPLEATLARLQRGPCAERSGASPGRLPGAVGTGCANTVRAGMYCALKSSPGRDVLCNHSPGRDVLSKTARAGMCCALQTQPGPAACRACRIGRGHCGSRAPLASLRQAVTLSDWSVPKRQQNAV